MQKVVGLNYISLSQLFMLGLQSDLAELIMKSVLVQVQMFFRCGFFD